MTDFKPTYRATSAVLEAEKDQANAWLMDQVREAFMKAPNLTDEHRAEFMANGLAFRHDIQRTSSGYGYSLRTIEHEDYFHVWKVRESHSGWKDIRIVIRKNGTINVDNIVQAAKSHVWGRLREKRQANVEQINRAEWDATYNITPYDYGKEHKITVNLSKTERGNIDVSMLDWDYGFTAKNTIRIRDLPAFKLWAETVRDGMNKWTESAKENINVGSI